MNFTNLSHVLNCMKEWESILTDSSQVVHFLDLGNYFSHKNEGTNAVLHAYPGISLADNELYMFLIPADKDIEQDEREIFNAITVCKVNRKLGDSDQIPETVAKARIDNWKKNHDTWAENQISKRTQTTGMFKAFYMPSSYMQNNQEYTTYFALKDDAQASSLFDADLITTNLQGTIAYYDTVKPVPPFSVTASESDFYLLQLAEQ